MPAPTTTLEIVDLIRRSGLIDPHRLDTFLAQSADDDEEDTTPRQVIDHFITAGLITKYQAEQFMLGKWRGFTIGKYKVLERLGFGGNGTVYLCEHLVVKRRVAVKVLPLAKAANPSALGRFYREARASGVLDHPNLVKAHDIDEENGLHFLVMEYVDGTNLQDLVVKAGRLTVARSAHYIKQAAQGLQSAHEAGLVHRDIKPSNILLNRDGVVKVLDLGLARFFNDETDLLTLKYDDNAVLGTADYVAPEQAMDSHSADIRADIYSLGCTFYYLLSGRPPFPTGKAAQKLIQHQTEMPKPIRELRPDVPAALAAVFEKMLAKEPARRYQTPGEVVAALAPWTDTPIPPPSDAEMPQLSPAARGENSDSDADPQALGSSARSPSRAVPKVKSVAQPSSNASPISVVRKPVKASDVETPSARNPMSPTASEAKRPLPPPAVRPALRTQLMPTEKLKPAANKTPTGANRNLRRLGGILIASVLIALMARWSLVRWNQASSTPGRQPDILIVSSSCDKGSFPSIAAALQRARAGDRIIVQAETWEEIVQLRGENGLGNGVQIEGRGPDGKPVLWRAPTGRDDSQPLLKIAGVSGLQVRGFTFDGQERVRELIVLAGACPGLTLEDSHLTGFQQSGVTLRNCTGEANRPVTLQRLRIVPNRVAASALYFDSRGEEINRSVRVLDCRLEGPYEAAVMLSGRTAAVELARNRIYHATDGVLYRKAAPAYPVGVRLESNTFYKIANVGVHFEAAPPAEGSRVEMTRNLFGQTARLAHVEGFVPEPRQTSARWIWSTGPASSAPRFFRLTFQVDGPSVSRAVLDLTADAGFSAWLNGEPIGSGKLEPQRRVLAFDVARQLRPGKNVLAVQATGERSTAGLLARLTYTCAGSDDKVLASDATWKVSTSEAIAWQNHGFDDTRWTTAVVVADYSEGAAAWRNLLWDKVVRDSFGAGKFEQLFPEPSGNYCDKESAESFPPLRAPTLKFTLPTDAANDATFLRYPPGSEPATAGSPGAPMAEAGR